MSRLKRNTRVPLFRRHLGLWEKAPSQFKSVEEMMVNKKRVDVVARSQ